MSKLTRTALAIEADLLKRFDSWSDRHNYANRSEAVRDLIRNALVEDQWADPDAEVVASLSIIFDHEARRLSQELTHLQHGHHDAVICSQHVHLDQHMCMETILLQGKAGQLRKMADSISSTKGVISGKLSLLATSL